MSTIQKSNNVSTKGLQFYNSVSTEDKSTMILGYWNDMVSIKIHPMLEGNVRQQGKPNYDYNGGLSTVLGFKSVEKILEGIKLIENGDIPCVSEIGSLNTVIKIGNGTEYGEDFGWYVAILEVDENYVSTNGYFYIFNHDSKGDVLLGDYDEQTGNFEKIVINTEFKVFKKFLESSMHVFTKSIAHSSLHRIKYIFDEIATAIAVTKGMIEATFAGGRPSTTDNATVGAPNTASNRNFASRRRRSSSMVQNNTVEEENNYEPSAPEASRSRRNRSSVETQQIDESELERELLAMDDDDDLNLD